MKLIQSIKFFFKSCIGSSGVNTKELSKDLEDVVEGGTKLTHAGMEQVDNYTEGNTFDKQDHRTVQKYSEQAQSYLDLSSNGQTTDWSNEDNSNAASKQVIGEGSDSASAPAEAAA
jgi:hypothetical protein